VHVRLPDRELADEFVAFLRRGDWIGGAAEVEAHAEEIVVEIEVPAGSSEAEARTELELYLKGWEAVYPDSPAELFD
jgi:hypothetical protein